MWTSSGAVRAHLDNGRVAEFVGRVDSFPPAAQRIWAELTVDERGALLAVDSYLASYIGYEAHQRMQKGDYPGALALYDDLVEATSRDLSIYCNALYAVQRDNNGLPPMPDRARHYLARCLPYAPRNPAIFFNAACVYFELGDRAAVVEHVRLAGEHRYDLEKVRADGLYDLMGEDDPQWTELFAHLEPRPYKDFDRTLADPLAVRKLVPDNTVRSLPKSLAALTNLEVLDLTDSLVRTLPGWLATLPSLRRIDISYTGIRSVPDEILAMPSLVELGTSYGRGPYRQATVAALLAGFARTGADHATRMLHAALFRDAPGVARTRGGTREFVAALDSNVGQVRDVARRLVAEDLAGQVVPGRIGAGDEIAVLGRINADRAVLAERLDRLGARLTRAVGPRTTLIVLGDQHRGRATAHVGSGVPMVFEPQLKALLDAEPAAAPFLTAESDAGTAERLGELLLSADQGNVRLAVELIRTGGLPAGLLEPLLLVVQNSDVEPATRAAARRLWAQHAPVAAQDAVRTVLNRTSLFAAGETKLAQRLTDLGTRSGGALDPTRIANLMLPGHGFKYLFALGRTDVAAGLAALTAKRTGTTLDLSHGELSAVPKALAGLTDLTELTLAGNHLGAVPREVFSLHNLHRLDLGRNRIRRVPPGIASLRSLRFLDLGFNSLTAVADELTELAGLTELDLSCNHFAAFPEVLGRMPALRKLHLSAERYNDRSTPFRELPAGIGALTGLHDLRLESHDLRTLPDQMRALTELRELHLGFGRLGHLPEWVAELPALTRLGVEHSDFGDIGSIRTVVQRLRARGVQVDGKV